MIDYKSIPSTTAQELDQTPFVHGQFEFTFTESIDENKLYNDINNRLTKLETSLDPDKDELESMYTMAKAFRIATDEKEEVLLRLEWLQRLYQAKEEIGSVDTKEKAKDLRKLISPVQTCPMKKQLLDEIDLLEKSLPANEIMSLSTGDLLMEKAIVEIGAPFINLGKAGREYVLSQVTSQYGDNVEVGRIKDLSMSIENRVNDVKEIDEASKLVAELDQLPLPSFLSLDAKRKEAIASNLVENRTWNGLATLDRMIVHHDKTITADLKLKQEMENTIQINDGKAAFAINIENDVNGFINVR